MLCVKPRIDTRRGVTLFTSHDGVARACVPVYKPTDIRALLTAEIQVLAVDECQFFPPDIAETLLSLPRPLDIICAGLDLDFRGVPFPSMTALMAVADNVIKLKARCCVCGEPAGMSRRLTADTKTVALGAADTYEARCRACHALPK